MKQFDLYPREGVNALTSEEIKAAVRDAVSE